MDTSRHPAAPRGEGPLGTSRERRRAGNKPKRWIRDYVLERDDWTCIDCRRRFPESLLEADHDTELADGGDNDDPRNYVTRCIPHHQEKTEERRMARTTGTPTKTNARTRVTAELPEKPSARGTVGVALVVAGAAAGAHALGLDNYARSIGLVGSLVVVAGFALFGARLLHWHRLVESRRVYEALCKVAGTPYAERRQRFKVHTWKGAEPLSVSIQYGRDFDPSDQHEVARLAAAFARAVNVPAARVEVARKSRGRARMTVRADEAAQETPARTDDARTDVPPPPATQGEVATRVRDAMSELLEGCTVEVTDWHPDGSPARLVVTYPAAATKAARDSRADLPVLMADVYEPRTTNGRWHVAWEPKYSRFVFTDAPDPLAPIVPLPPIEDTVDLTAGPVLGVTESGEPWRQPLLGNHVLVAGATGSGKGSVLWGIVRGVFRMIQDGRVRLWVIDPKGGMELGLLEPFAHRFSLADGAEEVLAEAVEVMEAQAQRLKRAGIRKHENPTVENPLHIILVDELAAITSLAADSKIRGAINSHIGKLLTQGRAVGVCVVSALQDPSKDTLKNRGLFPGRIGLRLEERTQPDMVLGAGARSAGAVCDMIPRGLPGVGYVAMDGRAGYLRVRAAFVPDEELARLVEPARTAPQHAQPARTEQLSFDSTPTGQPVALGEVLATANTPARTEDARTAAQPTRMDARNDDGEYALIGARVRLPNDPDPVTITGVEEDPDDPDARVEVTYVYDGETGERVCSFDADDEATPA